MGYDFDDAGRDGGSPRRAGDKAEPYQPKQDKVETGGVEPVVAVASERILNPISAAEFEGKPVPQRKWEVEQYIPRCKPVLLYGDGGAGKTTIGRRGRIGSV